MEKLVLMNEESVSRTINRLCHEIIENNSNCNDVVLIGIHNRGVPISQRIQNKIKELIGIDLQRGSLDITFHRDDYRERLVVPELMGTDINFSLEETADSSIYQQFNINNIFIKINTEKENSDTILYDNYYFINTKNAKLKLNTISDLITIKQNSKYAKIDAENTYRNLSNLSFFKKLIGSTASLFSFLASK